MGGEGTQSFWSEGVKPERQTPTHVPFTEVHTALGGQVFPRQKSTSKGRDTVPQKKRR